MKIHDLITEWAAIGPRNWAESRFGWLMPDGRPIELSPWQNAFFEAYEANRDEVGTVMISTVKKAGKTLLNALLTCHRWLTLPGLHYAIGNDQGQADELQTAVIAAMVKRHPVLRQRVKITKSELLFKPTGSRLVSLPMDYRGQAGSNHLTVSITEIWGFVFEAHQRQFEELTLPPLVDGLRIVDSYAGFEGESELLKRLWDRGLSGQRISPDWPIFMAGDMLAYIHSGTDAMIRCWRGTDAARERYYAAQAVDLRPATFNRLHRNEWAAAETAFIKAEWWQDCRDPQLNPIQPGNRTPLVLALDLARGAIGGDSCALVGLTKWRDGHAVRFCQTWQPSKTGDRFDHAALIGPTLDWLLENFQVIRLVYDPYEATAFVKPYKGRVKCQEFSQSGLREESDKYLFDSIVGRKIYHYGHEVLNNHVLNAAGHDKGENRLRLVKPSPTRKIDAVVALSMALYEIKDLVLPTDPASPSPEPILQTNGNGNSHPAAAGPVVVIYAPPPGAGSISIRGIDGKLEYVHPGQQAVISASQWQNISKEPRPVWQRII